ncbi:MAG TPA: GDSL-type esterase/lipase family protein [Polyangiaceae bacterium]|nr:GDSL-type esterase/lipase family protein [Polyangiaceae bacterium]
MTARSFVFLGLGLLFSQPSCSSSSATSSDSAGAAGAASTRGGSTNGGSATTSAGASGGGGFAGTNSNAGGGNVGSGGASAGSAGASGSAGNGGAGNGGAGASGAAGNAGSAGATQTDAWVGTWSASPQSGGDSFQDKTLRQIVHTSISGTSARIQLSNAFGNKSIDVKDVHIARRTSGSSIDPATDRVLKFGGQTSFTIPAGDVALSDAVDFAVPALSDVSVSFYLADSSGANTYHQQGTQTNYVASGDVSGNADLSNTSNIGSYYLLANLDVKNTGALGAVVTLGASITDGVASSSDSNRRWPNDLAVRLNMANLSIGVLNQGISGNKLLADGAGQSAINRFTRDVIDQPDVKWVIFSDDPINDLGAGAGRPSGDQLIAGLKQLVAAAHQAKLKYLCSTLTPFEGSGGWSADGETSRGQINAFIRGADSGCDGIVDQDTATHDPAHPTQYLPAYDAGDHLHPNEAGLQAIANAVDLSLFK